MQNEIEVGRVPLAPGSHASHEAPEGLRPTGVDPSRKFFLNRSEVVGALAMWAVRQSPYAAPERLEAALQAAHDRLPDEMDGWFFATGPQLRSLVYDLCHEEPEIAKWNEPKSGHSASMVFTSRYDRPAPDDDFIDLSALANNICRTLETDQYCDSDGSPKGGDACGSVHDSAGREASPERTGHAE